MSESRQQRRARERAERKAVGRPGPNLRPVSHVALPGSVSVQVEVMWRDDLDYAPEATWFATWKEVEPEPMLLPNGQDFNDFAQMTTFMDGDDLELPVAEILGAIAQQWPDDDITVSWVLDEDAEDEVEELGVTLPTRRPKSV